jgi:hypothetical protein
VCPSTMTPAASRGGRCHAAALNAKPRSPAVVKPWVPELPPGRRFTPQPAIDSGPVQTMPMADILMRAARCEHMGLPGLALDEDLNMSSKTAAGGHHFNYETDKCTKCGMTEEYFEDNGKPPCRSGIGISRHTQTCNGDENEGAPPPVRGLYR